MENFIFYKRLLFKKDLTKNTTFFFRPFFSERYDGGMG